MNLIRLLTYIAFISIYGCVGVNISSTKTGNLEEINSINLPYRAEKIIELGHPNDGAKTYKSEIKWCGVTAWLIVPIPLQLPVCNTHTEVTFKNGQPVSVRKKYITRHGFLCGPPVSLLNTFDGGDSSFCSAY